MQNEASSVSIQYVGLNVHKHSIDIATASEGRTDEVRHVWGRSAVIWPRWTRRCAA